MRHLKHYIIFAIVCFLQLSLFNEAFAVIPDSSTSKRTYSATVDTNTSENTAQTKKHKTQHYKKVSISRNKLKKACLQYKKQTNLANGKEIAEQTLKHYRDGLRYIPTQTEPLSDEDNSSNEVEVLTNQESTEHRILKLKEKILSYPNNGQIKSSHRTISPHTQNKLSSIIFKIPISNLMTALGLWRHENIISTELFVILMGTNMCILNDEKDRAISVRNNIATDTFYKTATPLELLTLHSFKIEEGWQDIDTPIHIKLGVKLLLKYYKEKRRVGDSNTTISSLAYYIGKTQKIRSFTWTNLMYDLNAKFQNGCEDINSQEGRGINMLINHIKRSSKIKKRKKLPAANGQICRIEMTTKTQGLETVTIEEKPKKEYSFHIEHCEQAFARSDIKYLLAIDECRGIQAGSDTNDSLPKLIELIDNYNLELAHINSSWNSDPSFKAILEKLLKNMSKIQILENFTNFIWCAKEDTDLETEILKALQRSEQENSKIVLTVLRKYSKGQNFTKKKHWTVKPDIQKILWDLLDKKLQTSLSSLSEFLRENEATPQCSDKDEYYDDDEYEEDDDDELD